MGAGWYREPVYPDYIGRTSVDELADMLVRDIVDGADGTDIRAGVIGEIGTEVEFLGPAQERVFRAAARAQRETGVAISTHCQRTGRLGPEQVEILFEEGVRPTGSSSATTATSGTSSTSSGCSSRASTSRSTTSASATCSPTSSGRATSRRSSTRGTASGC